eukprot:EG_transcript_10180
MTSRDVNHQNGNISRRIKTPIQLQQVFGIPVANIGLPNLNVSPLQSTKVSTQLSSDSIEHPRPGHGRLPWDFAALGLVAIYAALAISKHVTWKPRASPSHVHLLALDEAPNGISEELSGASAIQKALQDARLNLSEGKSPGAGLASAEEQAEAAYADLINTSLGFQGDLSEEEAAQFAKAGEMGQTAGNQRGDGFMGDAMKLFGLRATQT